MSLQKSATVAAFTLAAIMAAWLGEDHTKSSRPSPSGKYKAELIESDTGAVGGWISSVEIVDSSPSQWRRLLGRDTQTVFGADVRADSVHVVWKNDTQLTIKCVGCERDKIRLKLHDWGSINIGYE